MPEYGFSPTRIFPSKDRIVGNTRKYGSEKTRILAYFTQCGRKWVTVGSVAEPSVILFAMLKGEEPVIRFVFR